MPIVWGETNRWEIAMPPLSRPADFARNSETSALAAMWSDGALLDPLVQERRRAVAAEASYLSDLARRTALMRWRGLMPDSHA